MSSNHGERVKSKDGDNADEPSDGKDAKERDLLSFRDLQAPDHPDRQYGHQHICQNVDTCIDIPETTQWSAL